MALSDVAACELQKLRGLRVGAAERAAPDAWRGLDVSVRRLLVTLADVGDDVRALAVKDWREFGPDDKARIGATARYIAGQLNGAGAVLW